MKFKDPPHPRNKTRFDQNLVADQPGRMIFFSGFFVALILGLLFRGLTSPQKVQALVAEAASKIHKNIEVHFESAEVSLSHNGFPQLAVVIHKVEMTSSLTCWAQPRLVAREIILPFSLLSMIFERQPFKKIVGVEVELRLRAAASPCSAVIETEPINKPNNPAITLVHRRKDMDTSVNPTIDSLEIDHFRFQYDPAPEASMEVVDLSLQVSSQQPKAILLRAKTRLANLNGQVMMEYKEFPTQNLMLHFFGNWREGSYSFNADYKFADTSLTTDAELKRIPAVQLISFLKDYGGLREELDGRNIWVTFKGHSQGQVKAWEKTPLVLTDVRIEGDLGEIEVEEFRASQLKPFLFKPLQARIKNLKADLFLDFLKQTNQPTFLGNLGEFNGRLELIKDGEMHLIGRQTNMEFIFSNQGQRQVQKLTSFDGEINLHKNKWEMKATSFVLDQGQGQVELRAEADRDLKKIDVHLKAEDLVFADPVYRLMTGHEQKAIFNSEVQMELQNGETQKLTGYIRSPSLAVEHLHFEKLNAQFNKKNETFGLQLSSQTFQVSPPSKAFDILTKVVGDQESLFKLKQLSGRFEMTLSHNFYWKNLSAQLEGKPLRLLSEGQWDPRGVLSGKILLLGASPPSKWVIQGHRDQPQVERQP